MGSDECSGVKSTIFPLKCSGVKVQHSLKENTHKTSELYLNAVLE